ncbi:MAG TPA: NfeD family protein [Gryllotalpicola sp.]
MGGYEWIIWIALIIVFVVVEMLLAEFTFMMLALGALGGLVGELFGAPWWLSVIIAAAVALFGIFLLRPPLLRRLRRNSDPARSNLDAVVGSTGHVLLQVGETGGQVKLANGETWSAHLLDGVSGTIPPGVEVRVLAVDGASVVIEPAPSSAQLN